MDVISNTMWLMIIPLILIQLILMVVSIFDIVRNEQTNGPKWVWVLVVIFINLIGPILYFILGRRND
ncbi:PLD nuclease N-terminal domain-containing protein [Cytobacillus purgationiresistens]|uniref:Membrane-anchored protein YejM (Alkaline phosphatase superfamily) n=1 Tax=Cytobacillus purgationiresistens TaxID=863449 RepID=A0ABU0AQY2_9BACI|nr:PLD nuclease N-terminal domain-containing protein [Cytobacillus purgationiresistens]MDQ0273702.1 membrane-anchored protein YejM (alkaline phosphatase superfamily) [Cytobacillus purgationiresistens]